MNRYKAFLIHLTGSGLVLLLVFGWISLVWYPGALFNAAAGTELLRLLIAVDVTLGPLVTLIIFNPKKKLLKLDMAIVLLCQLAFLLYGLWSIYAARPVYMVFAGSHFYLVRANEIESGDLAKVTDPQFKRLPLLGPEFVGAKEPDDPKIKNDLVFAGIGGMGIQNLPQYFVPLNQVQRQIISSGKTSQQWTAIEANNKKRLQLYEQNHPTVPVSFVLLSNKRFILYVVLNTQTGAIIDII